MKFIKSIVEILFLKKQSTIIRNLGYSIRNDGQKRALVSYVVDSYGKKIEEFRYNTNRIECLLIIESLIKMGYLVDVLYCNDDIEYGDSYDLIFGFGHAFRRATKNNPNAKKILYMTEAHPRVSYTYENKRFSDFNIKSVSNFKVERSGTYYLESDFLVADSVICLGEKHFEYLTKAYPNKKIEYIYPTGVMPQQDIFSYYCKEELEINILWFGSRGVIHKGLDILIDAIQDLKNIQLHVCGVKEKQLKSYIKMIPNNVVIHGLVDPKSNDFVRIVSKCDYMFLPSASEGVSTSAITCMYAGLIPVITENCGTDFDGNAVIILEDNLGELSSIISKLTSKKVPRARKKELSEYALNKFNLNEFSDNFNRKLSLLLGL
ncbi:glycosyltransferase family 4 protein [Vibrio metschnikovii]|nr:glycosyltransferase family 4 protein [Vibrio metschnikovii]